MEVIREYIQGLDRHGIYPDAAALEALRQLRQNPQLVQKLQENTRYWRSLLREHEFNVIGETNIVPVILPPELEPKSFAAYLIKNHNLWISPVWYGAKPRLRIVVNALHTPEEMNYLVLAMSATRSVLSKLQQAKSTYEADFNPS